MQRTAIARALAGNPQIILADEPTGNLDAESGESVMKLLRDLNRERGMTMIVVTHDLNVARQADRIVRLNQGLVESFTPVLAA
jgi:ABC-type lipoprotein export system ATPase subunit